MDETAAKQIEYMGSYIVGLIGTCTDWRHEHDTVSELLHEALDVFLDDNNEFSDKLNGATVDEVWLSAALSVREHSYGEVSDEEIEDARRSIATTTTSDNEDKADGP